MECCKNNVKRSWMIKRAIVTFVCLLGMATLFAQQKFPATVNVALVPPYSVYLSDYISRSSNKLMVTITFIDFNEPSWDIYLKIKIESPNLRIRTRTDFVPTKSLKVIPGIPYIISGDELQQYFEFNNIDVAGMTKTDLATNGRLLEGNYTFCVEVYDYKSGKVISMQSYAMANIRLNEPPKLVLPANETVFPISTPQNINFQWQLADATITNLQYKLHLYELSDPKEEANAAIANNHALQVYESSPLSNSYFLYDINSPLLQRGKKYAWRIKAVQSGGRDEFKNNGFSKAGCFYYGYPENGKIDIVQPENYYSFSLRDEKFFRWDAPDNLTKNQSYNYEFKLARIQPGQSDTDAILKNTPYDTELSPELIQTYGYDIVVNKRFESNASYAWQVKAHTGEQTIASSAVYKFLGPPIIEAFYAGNHTVFVKKAAGSLSDLTGEGEVKVSASGATQKVYFNHVKIGKSGVLYVLSQGMVTGKYAFPPIPLTPEYAPNGTASFVPDSVKLSSGGMTLKGQFKWDFPHPVVTPNPAVITSKPSEIDFDEFRPLGAIPLSDSLRFELADPYGFMFEFTSGSDIVLRGNNKFYPRLNGYITLPQKIKDVSAKRIKLPFTNTHRLDIISEQNIKNLQSINLLDNTRLYLQPSTYIADFSETESPGRLANNIEWKGVYLTHSDFILDKNLDKNNQLTLKQTTVKTIDASLSGSDTCWVTTAGLQFYTNQQIANPDSIGFNTFASVLKEYRISILNSVLLNSYFKGGLKIPLFSESKEFIYTIPISERGFQFGYLDESLNGFKFTYNAEGGEQKLDITVNRAVFAGKERLDLNIDLAWPSLGIELKNLDCFKVWGNTSIGFLRPNGMISLPNQVNGAISSFPITVNMIGAGSNPGLYAFATTANVVMSEDVSGPDGAPVVNVYSINHNKLLGQYAKFTEALGDGTSAANADSSGQDNGVIGNIPGEQPNLAKIEEQINNKLNFSHADIVDAANSQLQAQQISAGDGEATDSITSAHVAGNKSTKVTIQQQAILHRKAQIAVNLLLKKYAGSLTTMSKGLSAQIDSVTLSINATVADVVHTVVDSMAIKVKEIVNDATITQLLNEVALTTKKVVSADITSSISAFSGDLKKEIDPVNIVSLLITSAVESVITDVIEKGISDLSIDDIMATAEQSIASSLTKLGSIPRKIAANATDLLHKLDPQKIFEDLFNALKQQAFTAAKNFVADKVADAISDAIGGNAGEALAKYVKSFPMDINGISKKFKGEALKHIVLDPVSVSMQTKILSLAGYIQFTPGDPEYGDVWKGDIAAVVKVPTTFSFNIAYLVGKKNGLNYWFGQVRPGVSAGKDALNDKKAYPLEKPVQIGPVEMMAASGRLYSHMRDNGKTILPDASVNYGAYLNVVLFDSNNHGKTLYLNVAAEFVATMDDEFVFDFLGKCMIRADSASIEGKDCNAIAKGNVHFNYNSAKHHLVGSGSLVVASPAVCAEGSFAVDIQPGKWYLAIGTRDNRIIFVPGCAGWSPTGWLIVDQNTAELGLGLQFSINTSVGFDIGIVALNVKVEGGVALGIMVKVQYSPGFQLMDAGIWAELWAKVIVDYKVNLLLASVKGSITLIDLYASANLTMHFNPPPKVLKGDVSGYLKLCGIVSCDFNASFEKQI